MPTSNQAGEVRCRFCGTMIIELAAPPYRYSCRHCAARVSTTGVIANPDPARLARALHPSARRLG